jgi:hypothetical protein
VTNVERCDPFLSAISTTLRRVCQPSGERLGQGTAKSLYWPRESQAVSDLQQAVSEKL